MNFHDLAKNKKLFHCYMITQFRYMRFCAHVRKQSIEAVMVVLAEHYRKLYCKKRSIVLPK